MVTVVEVLDLVTISVVGIIIDSIQDIVDDIVVRITKKLNNNYQTNIEDLHSVISQVDFVCFKMVI